MKQIEQKGAIGNMNGEVSISHSGWPQTVEYERRSYVDVVEGKG